MPYLLGLFQWGVCRGINLGAMSKRKSCKIDRIVWEMHAIYVKFCAPGNDGIPPRSSRLVKTALYSVICTNSSFSAGRRGLCPKTCVTPTSSRYTKINEIAVTATSLCPCSSWKVRDTCRASIPRGPVWFQGRKTNNRHDLLTETVTREVPWTETIIIHRLLWPNKSLRLG